MLDLLLIENVFKCYDLIFHFSDKSSELSQNDLCLKGYNSLHLGKSIHPVTMFSLVNSAMHQLIMLCLCSVFCSDAIESRTTMSQTLILHFIWVEKKICLVSISIYLLACLHNNVLFCLFVCSFVFVQRCYHSNLPFPINWYMNQLYFAASHPHHLSEPQAHVHYWWACGCLHPC